MSIPFFDRQQCVQENEFFFQIRFAGGAPTRPETLAGHAVLACQPQPALASALQTPAGSCLAPSPRRRRFCVAVGSHPCQFAEVYS